MNSSNLKFLERQFNTIKLLIPEANLRMSEALAPEKMVQKYFQQYASDWDKLTSGSYVDFWPGELSERETHFLYKKLMGIMKLLILLKRISKEAQDSQKFYKASLYQLLGRLSDQVLRENPTKPLPSFTQKEVSPTPKRGRIPPLDFWGKGKLPQKYGGMYDKLLNHSYHTFFTKISQAALKDLNHLHQLGLAEEKALRESKKIYREKEAKSQKTKREFEAKAFNILHSMYSVQLEFYTSLRSEAKPVYERFVEDLKSVLDR